MPEAAFLVIDSTEYMRNGDYFPNRIMAVQEAASLLCNAKLEQNQENTIGFMTMGGQACNVVETLTADVDRVVASITQIPISGKKPHFGRALQIASLALTHRLNPRAEKRIIAFVGSPLLEDHDELQKLAKKLRKDSYAVDIIAFGVEENQEKLSAFVETVNKDQNSRFLNITEGHAIVDSLMSSAIFLGNEAVAAMSGAGAAASGGAGGDFEFGVDPTQDPELAMVLRMSMEDERRRLAAVAAAQAVPPPAAAPAHPTTDTTATATTASAESEPTETLSEEELLELALKMSAEAEATSSSAAPAPTAAAPSQPASGATLAPDAAAAAEDEEFMKNLRAALDSAGSTTDATKHDESKGS